MRQSPRLLTTACTTIALLLGGCGPISSITIGQGDRPSAGTERGHRNGPPPHAPAHGYRHKHRHQERDLELVFDSDLGVYIVIDVPNRYYWNGYYLRIDGNQWYASANLEGEWKPRSADSLPPGMKKRKEKANRGQSKKSSPAKGHW
jgi:hypothetical protein